MRTILVLAAAAFVATAGTASAQSFNSWSDGTVMSGSANEFGFSADFRGEGAFLGAAAGLGTNSGFAAAGGNFSNGGFEAWANSANTGGMIGGGVGFGNVRQFDMNVNSFGQSFGEVNFDFDSFGN